MGEKKTKLIKRGGVVVALLAAAILMGSVNFNRNEAEASPSPSDKAPAAEKIAAPPPASDTAPAPEAAGEPEA